MPDSSKVLAYVEGALDVLADVLDCPSDRIEALLIAENTVKKCLLVLRGRDGEK